MMLREGQALFGDEELLIISPEEELAREIGLRVVQYYKMRKPSLWRFRFKPVKILTNYKIYVWKEGWFELSIQYVEERFRSRAEEKDWERGL